MFHPSVFEADSRLSNKFFQERKKNYALNVPRELSKVCERECILVNALGL